jgi:hypothetical protein
LIDVDTHTPEGDAISTVVKQGLLAPRSATEFEPNAALLRRDFAPAVKKIFALPVPERKNALTPPDIMLGTPLEEAVNSISSYLNPNILCPTCGFGRKFFPKQASSQGEIAVTLVSILLSQHRIQLVGNGERDQILDSVEGVTGLAPLARTYIATALKNNIIGLRGAKQLDLHSPLRRGEFATLLSHIEQRFDLKP